MVGRPMTGHADYVNSVTFAPNGAYLASASNDATIILWNVTAWNNTLTQTRRLATLTGHVRAVNAVAFSIDSKSVAQGCREFPIDSKWVAQGCRGFTN